MKKQSVVGVRVGLRGGVGLRVERSGEWGGWRSGWVSGKGWLLPNIQSRKPQAFAEWQERVEEIIFS